VWAEQVVHTVTTGLYRFKRKKTLIHGVWEQGAEDIWTKRGESNNVEK
jgi:hypothetical protein